MIRRGRGRPEHSRGGHAGRGERRGRRTHHRQGRATRRGGGRQRGRRLFAFDRELGARLVAGADEAGRGSLAGPLVAAAVLFDLERLTLADRRALVRLNDSKQHTEAAREELYPWCCAPPRAATIVSRCVRGIDSRGLHVTNLDALRSALLRVAVQDTICLVDGFDVPTVRARAARRDRRRLPQRGDRRGVGAGQGHPRPLHAPRRRAPPEWDFATNVGYSTPEHRAAIADARRLAAAPDVVPVDGLSSSCLDARFLLERVLHVLERQQRARGGRGSRRSRRSAVRLGPRRALRA